MTARLARITLFPIKSLDGVEVDRAQVLASGALENDRRWAFFDDQQRYINGKNRPEVLKIRSQMSAGFDRLTLQTATTPAREFDLRDRSGLEAWMSAYLGKAVLFREDRQQGFPDDLDSPGPTIVSTATLETVASWFPGMELDELRRRLRTNLEIEGVPAFWEDQLFAEDATQTIPFQLGDVIFLGVNPCQRCSVPTLDSQTGSKTDRFQQIFVEKRRETMPDWVAKNRFNHHYRLTINTRTSPQMATTTKSELRINDRLIIPNPK
jgi:uncharacterized protein